MLVWAMHCRRRSMGLCLPTGLGNRMHMFCLVHSFASDVSWGMSDPGPACPALWHAHVRQRHCSEHDVHVIYNLALRTQLHAANHRYMLSVFRLCLCFCKLFFFGNPVSVLNHFALTQILVGGSFRGFPDSECLVSRAVSIITSLTESWAIVHRCPKHHGCPLSVSLVRNKWLPVVPFARAINFSKGHLWQALAPLLQSPVSAVRIWFCSEGWNSPYREILWMDEILHHFETGNHCLLGIYKIIINPGFLRWCEMDFVGPIGMLSPRHPF